MSDTKFHPAPTSVAGTKQNSECGAENLNAATMAANQGTVVTDVMQSPRAIRFETFEFDPQTRELRKEGAKTRLHGQPLEILKILLERPGQAVTREDLQKKLWPADTFVDFEHSLNAAMKRLRAALGDSPEYPRFIETLKGYGYRFIARVDMPSPEAVPVISRAEQQTTLAAGEVEPANDAVLAANQLRLRSRPTVIAVLALAGVAALVAGLKIGVRDLPLGKPSAIGVRSIAVLPLKNLSKDPEQDYFAEGMTETLITELGSIGALRVISHTSVRQYKDTAKRLQEVARELQVDALVEGTVARSGDRVRITANLVQVSPESHLWAKSYERDLRDVLELQKDVAQSIANQISIAVAPQESARLAAIHPVDREAYELYLKGRYFFQRRTRENLKKAIEYFQWAINKDPSLAPAYAGLGLSVASEVMTGHAPNEVMPKAKALVSKALEIDDNLAEAHSGIAFLRLWYDFDWAGAQKEFTKAIELNPNDAAAHQFFASYLIAVGQFDQAKIELQRAHEIDPLSVFYTTLRCLDYYLMGENDRAVDECRNALEMDPNFARAHGDLASIYQHKRMYEQSFRELETAMTLEGVAPKEIATLRKAYETSGIKGLWRKQVELGEERSKRDYVDAYGMVLAYANLGEKDKALAWLQTAYQQRSPALIGLKVDPGFAPLRSDPRFQDLLRRIGLPQ